MLLQDNIIITSDLKITIGFKIKKQRLDFKYRVVSRKVICEVDRGDKRKPRSHRDHRDSLERNHREKRRITEPTEFLKKILRELSEHSVNSVVRLFL